MANSSLQAIRTKVRRLTRSPSEALLTTAQIDEYVNTFIQYDFPEHLRLFNLHTTFEFFTEPYIDVYETNTTDPQDPLYQFKQKYLTVNPPVYVAGYQAFFTQSKEQFFTIYPNINSIATSGAVGNGVATSFSGVINTSQSIVPPATQNTCLLRNNILFSSVDVNSNGLSLIDYPISPTIGNLYVPGSAPTSTTIQDPNNFVNYITGAYTLTYATAPGNGVAINSQVVLLQPSRPLAILFYDSKFTVRPVPDQPYRIRMEVYQRPTELLETGQSPQLEEWWQWIAYGCAKKVFEDRMDLESVQLIMPEYKKQEALVLRRTIVQNATQRVSTIYDESTSNNTAPGWGGGFGSGGSLF